MGVYSVKQITSVIIVDVYQHFVTSVTKQHPTGQQNVAAAESHCEFQMIRQHVHRIRPNMVLLFESFRLDPVWQKKQIRTSGTESYCMEEILHWDSAWNKRPFAHDVKAIFSSLFRENEGSDKENQFGYKCKKERNQPLYYCDINCNNRRVGRQH